MCPIWRNKMDEQTYIVIYPTTTKPKGDLRFQPVRRVKLFEIWEQASPQYYHGHCGHYENAKPLLEPIESLSLNH